MTRVYLHGSNAARAWKALRAGAEVCIVATIVDGLVMARSAFNHSMNYRSVVVFGTAREVTEEEELHTAAAAITSHVAPGREDEARMPTAAEYKQTLLLAVPLDEASAKVRTGPPKDDADDIELPIWAGVAPAPHGDRRRRIRAPTSAGHRRPSVRLRVPPTRRAVSSPVERGPRLRDSFRAMPRTAWVLFAGTFVLRLGSFVFPFLALYLTENGLSVTEAGLAIAGYGIGGVLAQLSGGLLTDRIGRRNAIAISMITSAGTGPAPAPGAIAPRVLAIVIVYSFFAELHRPASGALIADLVPPEHRVAAYAFNRLLFNLSFAIGLALGGLVAEDIVPSSCSSPTPRPRRRSA